MVKLGVNLDHIATLRQARKGREPEPVAAALLAEAAGADGITVHLREDRRHIQDRDVRLLREVVSTKLNLEMAASPEILKIALDVRPHDACLVPEKRQELTTEGGLDVILNRSRVSQVVKALRDKGVCVSLFIEPDEDHVKAAHATGAHAVELNTGAYANATGAARKKELTRLRKAGELAVKLGLLFNAGHGLTYQNVQPVAALPGLHELNIGHSIVARAALVGITQAVREMKALLNPL
ncbi:MAG: pyridoxine 5'-phosphate synthase, partial [bacterium]